jgi:16S rRNA (guanine1207-N2)-methyltransferase
MPSSTATDVAACSPSTHRSAHESRCTPSLRRLLARLDVAPGDTVAAVATRAAELAAAFAGGLMTRPAALRQLHIVTNDIREAEAVRRLPLAAAGRLAVHTGHTVAAAPVAPSVVLLWPVGWEGAAALAELVLEAATRLPIGGRLYVLAHRSKGATALQRDLRAVFGNASTVAKDRDFVLLRAHRGAVVGRPRTMRNAASAIMEAEVLGHRLLFETAPGIFSHRRLDGGTRLILETLAKEPLDGVRTLLELGCGYGPIGIALAALLPWAQVTLSDVDTRAVELAQRNIARNGVAGRAHALLSDGLRHLGRQRFDVIVSHFPLHIPAAERARLLCECRGGLTEGGAVYVGGLASYDLRRPLGAAFAHWWTVTELGAGAGDVYRILGARNTARPPPHRADRAHRARRPRRHPEHPLRRCSAATRIDSRPASSLRQCTLGRAQRSASAPRPVARPGFG